MGFLTYLEHLLFSSRDGKEYRYDGKVFHLDHDVCDNLLLAEQLCRTMMQAYISPSKRHAENPANYFIKDLHRAILKIWAEFDRICKKCGLTYFIVGGTLLGAYRHGGFIPWDDDFDVVMPSGDYERLVQEYNANNMLPDTKAYLIAPSRGNLFTKIEVVGDPLAFIDVFPCECYAEELSKDWIVRIDKQYREHTRKVLPDDPHALKAYFRDYRKQLGMTSVAYDSPECRTVQIFSESDGNGSQMFLSGKEIFPLISVPFENIELPAPKNVMYFLDKQYGRGTIHALPVRIRQHFKYHPLTIDQILNIKRFLRPEPLRNPQTGPRGRVGEGQLAGLFNFLTTTGRNFIAPVFSVVTYDTLKEYRVFYQPMFRLRADRLLRSYLEAIGEYQRLTLGKHAFPLAEGQLRKVQERSTSILQSIAEFCENSGLRYWLWLSTLLGAFRGGMFPAWSKKAVIMMPREDYDIFRSNFSVTLGNDTLQAKLIKWRGGVASLVMPPKSAAGVIIVPCDQYPETREPEKFIQRFQELVAKAGPLDQDKVNNPVHLHSYYENIRKQLGTSGTMIAPGCECPSQFVEHLFFLEKHIFPLQKVEFEKIKVSIPADPDMVLAGLYGDYMQCIDEGQNPD